MSLQQIEKLLNENEQLKKEVLRLEKIISDGFAEFLQLSRENKELKKDLEALKKITFEDK